MLGTFDPMNFGFGVLLLMATKLVLAAILGGVVGWEREVHERPAGLRTHVLVCLGATLVTLVSMSFVGGAYDPSRIAAQIVSGIGFLGAGTILRQGSVVRGLTTAASLWTVAGIGMAVGIGGMYITLAALCTLIVFLTLTILRRFEPALGKRSSYRLEVHIGKDDAETIGGVLEMLAEMEVTIELLSCAPDSKGGRVFGLRVLLPHGLSPDVVIKKLAEFPGLDSFEWI